MKLIAIVVIIVTVLVMVHCGDHAIVRGLGGAGVGFLVAGPQGLIVGALVGATMGAAIPESDEEISRDINIDLAEFNEEFEKDMDEFLSKLKDTVDHTSLLVKDVAALKNRKKGEMP